MKTLTLIQNKNLIYPNKDSDYEILRTLGAPTNTLTTDYFKTLKNYLTEKKVPFELVQFDTVHKTLLRSLRDNHSFEISKLENVFVLSQASTYSDAKLQSLVSKLKTWYILHYVETTITIRRSKNGFKLTVKLTNPTIGAKLQRTTYDK